MMKKELLARRRETALMIHEEGQEITLQRKGGGYVRTAQGGQRHVDGPFSLIPQRLWFFGTRADTEYLHRVEGNMEVNRSTLVGLFTADIKEGDEFWLNGRHFRVAWVHEDKRYETRARCEEVA